MPAVTRKPTPQISSSKTPRLFALDALRGLLAILMALDHANVFIAQRHSSGEYWGGRFPAYGDALSFLTRLVTHVCAPGFFFLMGAGMLLFATSRRRQGWSSWAIARHFAIRGGVLILLQLLLVNRAWELSPGGWPPEIYIGVLFALGGAMMVGAVLVQLRPGALLAIALVVLIGTELVVPDASLWGRVGYGNEVETLRTLLVLPGGDTDLWSNYPILPWLPMMAFGIAFGCWLVDDQRKAFRRSLVLGGTFLLAFLAIRHLNGFGNIRPRAGGGWIDFLNVVKYPPSISFTLLAMGPNLIVLALFAQAGERVRRFLRPLSAFGRAPLFFYVLHLFVYACLGRLLTPGGTSIPTMLALWLLGLLILFGPTLWYGGLKRRQPPGSILRFL